MQTEGVDGAATAAMTFAPVLNIPEFVVFAVLMGGFVTLRVRTEAAIKVRDERIEAEERLRELKVKSMDGLADKAELDAAVAAISSLQLQEDDLLSVFGQKDIRIRIPPPPGDPDERARKRVQDAANGLQDSEERLPAWQEFLLVAFTVGILSPFLLLAVADPMKTPSIALQTELQNDPNAPPAQALSRQLGQNFEE